MFRMSESYKEKHMRIADEVYTCLLSAKKEMNQDIFLTMLAAHYAAFVRHNKSHYQAAEFVLDFLKQAYENIPEVPSE